MLRLRPLLVAFLVGLPALPAGAAGEVTLEAVPAASIPSGGTVTFRGAVPSASDGDTVQIVNADDPTESLAPAATISGGAYDVVSVPLTRNVRAKAVWGLFESEPLLVLVRPKLTIALSDVRLFDRALVRGTIDPPHDGQTVTVQLLRKGVVMREATATISDGRFRARLGVRKPGTYRAKVIFPADVDHAEASKRSDERTTPLPTLRTGSRNRFVRLLERRLRDLRYRVPAPDTHFDHRTADAVLAFRKVQGIRRTRIVTASTWRKLASPRKPRARSSRPWFHIEVDQTKQVLYLVRGGRITSIVHVSTGGPGIGTTYDGTWRVHRRLAGYSPGRLYYPAYFHGNRAIHGWPDVPPTPASHGCVRVPMWTAQWLYDQAPVGRVIKIYHS
ncbi:MAG TPA: L,D-transpeptidase [Actinomycetota bacterium]|nr:L,D-transpeptidase [Actinomycetota bacterium]